MTCSNCESVPVYARGLCRNCFEYHRRTGKARPEELIVARARRAFEREAYRRLVRDVVLAQEGEIA